MSWVKVGSAAVGGLASYAGAQAKGRASAAAAKRADRQFKARKRAYDAMIGRASGDLSTAEKEFGEQIDIAPEEIGTLEQEILSGQSEALQEGSKQAMADLTRGGMRGGQLGTALRRQAGETTKAAQKDITQLRAQEAIARAREKRAFQAQKAGRAQSARYQTF